MKIAEIHLPYFKQGDDLARHLADCDSVEEALEMHAQCMEVAAGMLMEIAERIEGHDVTMRADTHWISIEGPDELIDELIAEDLAEEYDDEFDDEEDEEFESDEDEDDEDEDDD